MKERKPHCSGVEPHALWTGPGQSGHPPPTCPWLTMEDQLRACHGCSLLAGRNNSLEPILTLVCCLTRRWGAYGPSENDGPYTTPRRLTPTLRAEPSPTQTLPGKGLQCRLPPCRTGSVCHHRKRRHGLPALSWVGLSLQSCLSR